MFPQTILINPSFKVLDKTQLIFREGCRSIHGYGAFVPRYKTIQVEAYNENGDPITHVVHNWTARIFQHEIDSLRNTPLSFLGKSSISGYLSDSSFCYNRK